MKYNTLLFLLFSVLCYSQQRTYDVKEGELYFIHPKKGIILKGNDGKCISFRLFLGTYEEAEYYVKSEALSDKVVKELLSDKGNIFPDNIVSNYKFDKLRKIAFKEKNDEELRRIQLIGPDNFTVITEKKDQEDDVSDGDVYFFLIIGNKKLVVFGDYTIVPLKKGLKLVGKRAYNFKLSKPKNKLSGDILYNLNSKIEKEFYRTDTLNGKVGVSTILEETRILPEYDSINFHTLFIAAYKKDKPVLYNWFFEKLHLPGLRAFREPNHWAPFGIVLQNFPRCIDIKGDDNQVLGYSDMSVDIHPIPHFISIMGENNLFFIEIHDADIKFENESWDGEKRALYHTENIDTIVYPDKIIELYNPTSKIPSNSVVYCKMKDGTYKIEYLQRFLQKPPLEVNIYPDVLPEKLDFVEVEGSGLMIYKNGLKGCYPYNKEPKYKDLGNERFGFFRFEMPDGRKGWLDKKGKEYLDE